MRESAVAERGDAALVHDLAFIREITRLLPTSIGGIRPSRRGCTEERSISIRRNDEEVIYIIQQRLRPVRWELYVERRRESACWRISIGSDDAPGNILTGSSIADGFCANGYGNYPSRGGDSARWKTSLGSDGTPRRP